MPNTTTGWEQIRAGIELVKWSQLAHWDKNALCFTATNKAAFEPTGHLQVHEKYGRLICWITFGVGSEYLAKGVSLLNGCNLTSNSQGIRAPKEYEDINHWSKMVISNDPAVKTSRNLNLGTFKNMQNKWDKILKGKPKADRNKVKASFKLLAEEIRNRDAHYFEPDVRALNFDDVERLFIPAFNILLNTLDQGELGRSLSKP